MLQKPIPVKMERAKHVEIATREMAIERNNREANSCVLRMGPKAAKALGLTVPRTLQVAACEVIE
jgi:hypothetical protein